MTMTSTPMPSYAIATPNCASGSIYSSAAESARHGSLPRRLGSLPGIWARQIADSASLVSARLEAASSLMRSSHDPASAIFLGTPAVPFEALPSRRLMLDRLEDWAAEGERRMVVISCRSAAVLRELPALEQLDQDHALRIDLWITVPEGGRRRALAKEGFSELETARRLAAAGLDVRLVIEPHLHEPPAYFERIFEASQGAGVADVELAARAAKGCDPDRPVWEREVERLRLEHGFPSPRPGRG